MPSFSYLINLVVVVVVVCATLSSHFNVLLSASLQSFCSNAKSMIASCNVIT